MYPVRYARHQWGPAIDHAMRWICHLIESILVVIQMDDTHTYAWMETLHIFKLDLIWIRIHTHIHTHTNMALSISYIFMKIQMIITVKPLCFCVSRISWMTRYIYTTDTAMCWQLMEKWLHWYCWTLIFQSYNQGELFHLIYYHNY